jgi:hypothetical protein
MINLYDWLVKPHDWFGGQKPPHSGVSALESLAGLENN